jgi:transcriptional regulator with XRE-family HTH domain
VNNGKSQALGEILRQAREDMQLSLEEVERETRIRAKFLAALESGELSALPSDAHAKGFLRNYAQFLGLDAQAMLSRYDSARGSARTVTNNNATRPAPAPPAPRPAPLPEPDAPQGPLRVPPGPLPSPTQIKTGPVVPGPAQPAVPYELPQPAEPPPEPARDRPPLVRLLRSDALAFGLLGVGLVIAVLWGSSRLRQAPGREMPTQQSAFLEELSALNTSEPAPTFPPTSTPTVEPAADFFDRVVLTINVTQRSWVRIEVDGVMVFEGQVEPDTILQYEGAETVRVLTGNGAGLEVTFNGRDQGPLGERGEVVEHVYTVEGLYTTTPTITPSPTETGVPTPTPRDGTPSDETSAPTPSRTPRPSATPRPTS